MNWQLQKTPHSCPILVRVSKYSLRIDYLGSHTVTLELFGVVSENTMIAAARFSSVTMFLRLSLPSSSSTGS